MPIRNLGACPFYEVGAEYLFERYGDEDTFWTQGKGAHCSEAWDCFSRYVYTALQGGSIMRNWTKKLLPSSNLLVILKFQESIK